jgi:hypothetical protein
MARGRKIFSRLRNLYIISGVCAAGLLLLGFDRIAPIGGPLETVCVLAGVASAILFVGLVEGV